MLSLSLHKVQLAPSFCSPRLGLAQGGTCQQEGTEVASGSAAGVHVCVSLSPQGGRRVETALKPRSQNKLQRTDLQLLTWVSQ